MVTYAVDMRIGDIDIERQTLVVAEIGNNHEGDFEVARRLVEEAARSGAHAVKLQTFRTEHYVSKQDESRFNQLKSYELDPKQFEDLAELSNSLGLLFISTPLDLESAAFLEPLVDCFKIASGDNDFFPLIRKVAESDKPMIVSSGITDADQLARTIAFITSIRGTNDPSLALLHCVSSYPTPPTEVNLLSIPYLRERFGLPVGYSDHTMGTEAAVLAVALGAQIVEKHFTLEGVTSDFRDHKLSATPSQMKELVERVEVARSMLGSRTKAIQPAEKSNVPLLRRSIVAGRDLEAGHELAESDLTWLRPGGGLPPGEEERLIGRRLRHPVNFGERLSEEDVE